MPARRWRLPFIALGLAAPAFWAAGQAQDSVPSSPPELRDFELKPSSDLNARIGREPRPEPEPGLDATIRPPAQAPVVMPEQPVRLQPPAPTPQATRPAAQEPEPSPTAARVAPRQPAARPAPNAPPPVETLPAPPAVETTPSLETAAPTQLPIAQVKPAPSEPADDEGLPWLNILLGALAALGIGYALVERRRAARARAEAEQAESRAAAQAEAARRAREAERARAAPAETPKVAPVPAPAPAAENDRPWIELDFAPETAAATDRDAQVQYRLAIRNAGNSPARNVRIEARMFNIDAEQKQEIAAFFAAPVNGAILPPRTIPEAGAIEHRGVVAMPREEMRAIMVEGRSLFIPVVAFNVLYEWGDGHTGQTALSYVVGREIGSASEKMGPFRLDLGPRLYRSVGQRRNAPALVA
jgi:hypothetical protein